MNQPFDKKRNEKIQNKLLFCWPKAQICVFPINPFKIIWVVPKFNWDKSFITHTQLTSENGGRRKFTRFRYQKYWRIGGAMEALWGLQWVARFGSRIRYSIWCTSCACSGSPDGWKKCTSGGSNGFPIQSCRWWNQDSTTHYSSHEIQPRVWHSPLPSLVWFWPLCFSWKISPRYSGINKTVWKHMLFM